MRTFVVLTCILSLLTACRHSVEDSLVGEWSIPQIDATARATYKADHTYVVSSEGLGNGTFGSTGTWQLEGDKIISRFEGGESKATIVKITRNDLEIKTPEDVILHYKRLK